MAVEALEKIEQTIEQQSFLDRLAGPLQRPLHEFLEHRPRLRSLVHGTWLGHPLHAALTDWPVGAWTATLCLDLLDWLRPGRGLRSAATATTGFGLVGALAAATAGLADWTWTSHGARRLGLVHGLANLAVTGLYTASLLARLRGDRGRGIGLAGLGYGLLAFSTWLGGHLAYRCGVGVNRTAFQSGPRAWTPVLPSADLAEGQRRRVVVGTVPVLLSRLQGRVYAIGATCPHLGGPLDQGRVSDLTVTCPWHYSQFRLTDGQVLAGPATASALRFETRERDGQIEIRQAEESCQP